MFMHKVGGLLVNSADSVIISVFIGVIVLVVRIALSYVLKPLYGGRTIALAEGIAWFLMLVLFALRILWQHRRVHARKAS